MSCFTLACRGVSGLAVSQPANIEHAANDAITDDVQAFKG